MGQKQYIVTIEICSSKIVGIVAEKTPNATVCVNHIETANLTTGCVRHGIVKNVEDVKHNVTEVIKRLESHISPNKISGVYVGISGRSLHSVPVSVTCELDPNQVISEDVITDIDRRCRAMSVEGDILEVLPCVYLVDDNETRMPIGSYGNKIVANMNLIVAKSEIQTNLRRVFDNVKVLGYIVTPTAVADKILDNEERQLGCMLVDFGAETTTVSIYKNEVLQYLATLPLGSRLITRDITSLNLTETKAEELKRTVGNAMGVDAKDDSVIDGAIKSTDVSNYVQARVGEINYNIAEQVKYAGMDALKDLARGVKVIGGGSLLNGFIASLNGAMNGVNADFGHHCPYVDILAHDAHKSDYIQSVALAARAAELISPTENCTYIPEVEVVEPPYQDAPDVLEPIDAPDDFVETRTQKPQQQPKRKGDDGISNRWRKFKDLCEKKVGKIFEDDEEDNYNK